jgi:predicted O-methyltransferase YrrM
MTQGTVLYEHETAFIRERMSNPNVALSASHLPMLMWACSVTDGPIIEFGVGMFSTPILHEISRNRELISIESNPHNGDLWYKLFAHLGSSWHRMVYLTDWRNLDEDAVRDKEYSVAFIDPQPSVVRPPLIRLVADCATYVVVHDTEPEFEGHYLWGGVLDSFKYRLDYKQFPAWTTILSNEVPIKLDADD